MEKNSNPIDGVDGLDELAEIDLFAEELPQRMSAVLPPCAATASTIGTLTGCLGSASTVSTLG